MVKLNSKCCIWISVLGPTLVLNGGSKRGPSAFSFFIVCFLLDFRFCFLVIQGSMGLKYWFSTLLPGSIFRKTRRSWLIYSFRSKVVSVTVDSIITVIISFHLLLSATKDYKQLIISLSAPIADHTKLAEKWRWLQCFLSEYCVNFEMGLMLGLPF